MRVACHFTIPRPPYIELDAVVQDGLRIVSEIGGEVNFLYPGEKACVLFPRFLSGFQQLPYLRKLDNEVNVHHIFTNGFYPYPIFLFLKKPIILSTGISLLKEKPIRFRKLFRNVQRFVVPTLQDQQIMRDWGYDNVTVVTPGIDLSHLSFHSCRKLQSKFTLLMGSAPWNLTQFDTKGVDLLLQVVQELPWLEVVFLWRGLFLEEIKKRVANAGVRDRVTILSERVEIDKVLAEVHGAIILAKDTQIIKGYPHSLIEAMAAGKPVIVSECLAISDFVKKNRCGEVIASVENQDLMTTITSLRENYSMYCHFTREAPIRVFSSLRMIEELKMLYQSMPLEV